MPTATAAAAATARTGRVRTRAQIWMDACAAGALSVVDSHYDAVADCKRDLNQGLTRAAENGRTAVVAWLWKKSPALIDWDFGVMAGCRRAQRDVVKYLITARGYRDIPVHVFQAVCEGGDMALIDYVFKLIKTKPTSKFLSSGLMGACMSSNYDVVKFVMDTAAAQGVKLDWNCGLYGATANNDPRFVMLMFANGALDTDAGLHGAIDRGHEQMAKAMVNLGAKDFTGGLKSAARHGHAALVKLMLQLGNPTVISEAVYLAGMRGNIPSLQLLLSHRAFNNHRTNNRINVIKGACVGRRRVVMVYLNTVGLMDWNLALRAACSSGDMEMATWLVENGANDWDGCIDLLKIFSSAASKQLLAFMQTKRKEAAAGAAVKRRKPSQTQLHP